MERNDLQCTTFMCCFKRHHCGVFSQQMVMGWWFVRMYLCMKEEMIHHPDPVHRVAVLLIGRYFWCNFNRYALWVLWCLVIIVYSVTYLSCLWMSDVQRQVTNSKQFPFRFFSAYEVLQELEKSYHSSRKFTWIWHFGPYHWQNNLYYGEIADEISSLFNATFSESLPFM